MLHNLAYKISAWNRARKWKRFQSTCPFDETTAVLDVGFNNEEYSDTDNYLEKNYPYVSQITALGIGDTDIFQKNYPDVTAVTYDGKTFPFDDKKFDIVWSNAVIEHVGDTRAQQYFLSEMMRVGKKIYMTTPNKFFPFEVHTRVPLLHILLPKRWFDACLRMIGKSWATGDYMYLLSKKDIERMLADVGCTSYKIHHNRLLGFTLDFVIIIDA